MTYFWAGLLAGLAVWVLAELMLYLRKPVSKNLWEQIFVVVQARGKVDEIEYDLRRIRADLEGCGFADCRILLAEQGLDSESKKIAARLEGVRLCTAEEFQAMPVSRQ